MLVGNRHLWLIGRWSRLLDLLVSMNGVDRSTGTRKSEFQVARATNKLDQFSDSNIQFTLQSFPLIVDLTRL